MAFEDPSLPNQDQPLPVPTQPPVGSGFAVRFAIGFVAAIATLTTGMLNPYHPAATPSIPVQDRLDPNIATAWELDRIPGVGSAVARRIVDARGPSGTANAAPRYLAPQDLLNLNGVGPAMVESLTPYLRFPAYKPAPR